MSEVTNEVTQSTKFYLTAINDIVREVKAAQNKGYIAGHTWIMDNFTKRHFTVIRTL
jgi:hypothetical protein